MGKLNGRRLGETGRVLSLNSGASRFGSAQGQDMVEFSMVVIFFLLLCFAVMQYGWLMFAQLNVQQAVDDAGRYASTGQSMPSQSRIQSIVKTLENEISIPSVNGANVQICSIPPGGSTSTCYIGDPKNPTGPADSAGGPSYTVTLTLNAKVPLWTPMLAKFFSGGTYNFTSSATFKNESFDPSDTD